MNKQIVIAGLLGAAAAADCADAFTKENATMKAMLEGKKAALATENTVLTGLATAEATAYTACETRYNDQVTLMAPFKTALTTATANHKTQADASAAAATAITALAPDITSADTALATATGLVTAQNVKIAAQAALIAKLDAAVTEHTALEAVMDTALNTATTAETTASTAVQTALTAKTALETIRDKASTGPVALKVAAASAAATALTATNTQKSSEAPLAVTMKDAQAAMDTDALKKATIEAACVYSTLDCKTYLNDPVRAILTTVTTALGDGSSGTTQAKNTAVAAWDTLRDAVSAKQDLQKVADVAAEVADANVTTNANAITAAGTTWTNAKTTLTAKTAEKGTATTNKATATTQKTQATTDQGRGAAVLATLKTALTPLTDDVVVKKYLKKIQDDKKVVQNAAKAAADVNLADLAALKAMAKETVDRATKKLDFYNGLMVTAKAAKTLADGQVTKNAAAATANATMITKCTAQMVKAVAMCKGMGFAKAQAAMKALIDKNAADAAAAATVKTAYDAKAAFATGGETNSLCGFPAKATAAAKQDPRPVCKDGFCCGAAQKFMRDGTMLAVETCQKATGVHTYQFYPPLPAGAVVEPMVETWRFQCISGAQKLVAVATAALAASYMMA